MAKQRKPRKPDPNVTAFNMLNRIAAKSEGRKLVDLEPPKKNQAAVELGRLGGLKGGKARAKKLSATKRKAIAKKAAKARWASHSPDSEESS